MSACDAVDGSSTRHMSATDVGAVKAPTNSEEPITIDGGATFIDGRPLFGSSKTVRGLMLSILATTAFAPLIGLDWRIGALVALMAMIGDLSSSFLKRRMGLDPSDRAIGLDQIPESLLPLLACAFFLPLTLFDLVVATAIFFVGELALSRLLFKLHIRNRPY